MSNNIRTIYLYIVSFISLVMIVGGIMSFVYSVVSYNYPVVSGYYSYKENEMFKYEDEYIEDKKQAERESLRNSILSVAVIGVGVPIHIYHWKKAKNVE